MIFGWFCLGILMLLAEYQLANILEHILQLMPVS